MRGTMFSRSFLAAAAVMTLAACSGTFATPKPEKQDPQDGSTGSLPVPACPQNPDCALNYDAEICRECPEYWVCEDLPSGKRCTNPGPDLPGDGDWDCDDDNGTTVCRGDSFPDGGGDTAWDCTRSGEYVVCENDSPAYPDGQGEGPWNCYFQGEFRVCESGTPGGGDGWVCVDNNGTRECRNYDPELPDDRDWNCYDRNGVTTCAAPGALPDGGVSEGWDCERAGELVLCKDDSPEYPDGGSSDEWNCVTSDELRLCAETDGGNNGGDYPGGNNGGDYPGGNNGGNNGDNTGSGPNGGDPDYPNDGYPENPGEECVAGTQRWCDDAIYCSWGKQTCLPDGVWGPCVEPTVGRDGLADRPDTACGCRYFYFNDDCCEDQRDRDGDGKPDCLIPESHEPPACESDGGVCSYCDNQSDCGYGDLCLFQQGGYAFCGQDCSDSGCPGGFSCQTIETRNQGRFRQCVPNSGYCE